MIIVLFFYLHFRYLNDFRRRSKYLLLASLIFYSKPIFMEICSIMLALSIVDYFEHIIPNELNFSLLSLGLFYKLNSVTKTMESSHLSLIFAALFIIILAVISFSGDSIGFGDVKLLAAMLLITSASFLLDMIFVLTFLLLIVAVFFLIKDKNLKGQIAFGPLVLIAFVIVNALESIY